MAVAAGRCRHSRFRDLALRIRRKELWFEVPARRAYINITPQVEQCLAESGIREGLVLVNAKHI